MSEPTDDATKHTFVVCLHDGLCLTEDEQRALDEYTAWYAEHRETEAAGGGRGDA